MKKIPEDSPDCMVFLLAKAYQKSHSDFKKRLKPYGLTNMQHLVLEGLWYHDGVTASELGRSLILDKATLSGVLDRMVDAGWIIKKQDAEDLRIYRLFPSVMANEMKDLLIEERKKANEDLLADYTLEEKILLKRLLIDLL